MRNYDQVMQHPQAVFNQTVDYFEQSPGLSLPYVFIPGLSQKPILNKAPDIGEHTIDVLQKFNFSQEQIDALIASQVIRQIKKEEI